MKLSHLNEMAAEGLSHDADITKKVLFNETELPASVRLSHAVFRPGQQATAHSHDDLTEVFYVTGGTGEMIVDGVGYTLRAGSAMRVDAGEVHTLINTGAGDLTVLYFGLRT